MVYVYRNDRVEGPFDELVLQQALANGTMSSQEFCSGGDGQEWMTAAQYFAVKTPALNRPSDPARSTLTVAPSTPTKQVPAKESLAANPAQKAAPKSAAAYVPTWRKVIGGMFIIICSFMLYGIKQQHEKQMLHLVATQDDSNTGTETFIAIVGVVIGSGLCRWEKTLKPAVK